MRRAVCYLRVSSGRQVKAEGQEDASLPDQLRRCRAWADLNAYALAEDDIFEDAGKSAWKNGGRNRPGFKRALKAGRKSDAFLVYNLLRFGRSSAEILLNERMLRAAGCRLVSLSEAIDTGTASGEAMFGMLAVFAQWDSSRKSEQMREVLAYKKAAGRKIGSCPPYGWRYDGGLMLPEPREQEVRERILELREAGQTYRAICAALSGAGLRAGTRDWHPNAVRRVVEYAPPA